MICRFCQQWNPAEAKRCVFCQNLLDAQQDRTAGGALVQLSQDQIAQLPIHVDSSPAQLMKDRERVGISVPQWVIVGIVVAGVIVWLLSR